MIRRTWPDFDLHAHVLTTALDRLDEAISNFSACATRALAAADAAAGHFPADPCMLPAVFRRRELARLILGALAHSGARLPISANDPAAPLGDIARAQSDLLAKLRRAAEGE